MEYIVTGCENCIFAIYTDELGGLYCTHPLSEKKLINEDDEKFDPITPNWCPLNKEEITIKKE